jgi:hypothetical protein
MARDQSGKKGINRQKKIDRQKIPRSARRPGVMGAAAQLGRRLRRETLRTVAGAARAAA